MNEVGILKNICNVHGAIQSEVISINFHCRKCGKFKKKNTKSVYCFKCLGV
jgi:Zn finger protein HypA/HybF involved in hydrogenase expression